MFVVAILVVLTAVQPVSAVTFEVVSFTTDKLVYEVGETIYMASQLTASYNDPGYCHIAFLVVTDQWTVYEDAYYIDSSPDLRTFTSAYTILPSDTSPGENGIQATVQFNYEFVDERLTDSGVSSILINITRGHLSVVPISDMQVVTNSNASLSFKISSIHNDAIFYKNESVTIRITNSSSTLFETNTITDSLGVASINWSTQGIVPDSYNVTVIGDGNSDFLPITESFDLTVKPPPSFLDVLSLTDEIYCISNDGSDVQYVNVSLVHVDDSAHFIEGGTVTWNTSFSDGLLNYVGNGLYNGTIPFPVLPNTYRINFTATHNSFQSVTVSQMVQVLPRPLNSTVISGSPLISGYTWNYSIFVYDNLTSQPVSSLPVDISFNLADFHFNSEGLTSLNGWLNGTILFPSQTWGNGSLTISINASSYYNSYLRVSDFPVYYHPNISVGPTIMILGETTELHCVIQEPDGSPINGLPVMLYDSQGTMVATNTTDSNGSLWFHWNNSELPPQLNMNYTIFVPGDAELFRFDLSLNVSVPVKIPVSLNCTPFSIDVVRNNTIVLKSIVSSQWLSGISFNVTVMDLNGTYSETMLATEGMPFNLSIFMSESEILGPHVLKFVLQNNSYIQTNPFFATVNVYGSLICQITPIIAYYSDMIHINVSLHDELGIVVNSANITLYLDETSILISSEHLTNSTSVMLDLPSIILPGFNTFRFEIAHSWLNPVNVSVTVFVWIRTNLTLTISDEITTDTTKATHLVASRISIGSIIRPPPILFNGSMSTIPSTARPTSLDNCPRLSSGTNNRSTDLANSLTTLSGNGHTILNLNERILSGFCTIASSTALEVHPKDITPHFADSGPVISTSVRLSCASVIFLSNRRTSLSWTSGSDVFLYP